MLFFLSLISLHSLACGIDLVFQAYEATNCSGTPLMISIERSPAPTCSNPTSQCYPNSFGPERSIYSQTIQCSPSNGFSFPFPKGYMVEYSFSNENCAGNTTETGAYMANTCIVSSRANLRFDCEKFSITMCANGTDCNDPCKPRNRSIFPIL